jgi:hypothetical protein
VKPWADHPLVVGLEAVVADEQRQVLEFLPGVGLARMGHDHLRMLLEDRRDVDHRNALLHRAERLEKVAAHVEVHAAGEHQGAVVDLRSARQDLDLEPAIVQIGAVGDGLVEAAVLGLGEPVRAEDDRFLRCRGAGRKGERRDGEHQGFRRHPYLQGELQRAFGLTGRKGKIARPVRNGFRLASPVS